ncbi:3',5'-nucleoside bisphosphate phosphatase [Hydrogenovibrio crunogenus]|uniref:3',5'-nucleoside bisphosphate phosphatase n=1 Tax=Hydrogenovibrio crunogenus TaxID=39765 RepID=A0A4P7P054_9GAMM|nr:PHP domain-containing protein [Hydrogenovibrio crunogenus]QBZ83259.1 3',5'-nucleoside bisphosphate phosphatase [Hydrogenovibrio crunogenus]
MKVDFHCHTSISDGALTPKALVDLAKEKGITTLAITDHDTTHGYELIKDYAVEQDLELIAASEISCQWKGHTIHIVGLEVDIDNPVLKAGLKMNRIKRWKRAFEIDIKFQRRNLNGILENILPKIQEGMIGRNHFAQALIEKGVVKNQRQAFDKYLKKGRPMYAEVNWPELEEVVGWIKAANGIAVIAHPHIYKMTSNKLNKMIEDFKAAGGQAIEVVNQPRVCAEQTGMADRAERFELYASMGSDFHRPEHTWRGLGWLAPMPTKCTPVWELFETPITTS